MDDPTEPRPQRNGTCLALTSSETDTGQTRPGKARQGEGHPQDTAAVGHQATPTHIKIEPPSPPQAHRRLTTHAHRSPQSARKHRAPQPLHHAAQHAPRRPWGAAPAAHAPTATLYATRAPWKAAVRRKSRVVRERHRTQAEDAREPAQKVAAYGLRAHGEERLVRHHKVGVAGAA